MEIVTRIRFRKAAVTGRTHDGGKRFAAIVDVEQVSQGPGQDALDRMHPVTGINEIPNGLDDRQRRANRRFVQVMTSS